MDEYLVKFAEYLPLYFALVLFPALIRTIVDVIVLKIPSSAFSLPPSREKSNLLNVRYETAFSSIVETALYAPLVEEIVFRAAPYLLLGVPGLVVGNAVWVLAHPAWQLRYVSGMKLWQKIGFTISSAAYYICAAIFFSIPWVQGFGLLAIVYHMMHNGVLTLGGIFSEIELPAPWKKEDVEYFREARGVRRKIEEHFFRDTKPMEDIEEDEDLDVDIVDVEDRRFFKDIVKAESEREKAVKKEVAAKRVAANVAKIEDDWLFWR